ncbi:protein-L-isoaspartate O-methyltransferase family protein [Neorhizobium alkalisoli]|uniref:Protein-L-isoaspartate O-methyltransferase n=1 Tax=Neorhizobium alkalisoli TaxID=528178 RepID=A0A561R1D4_9HYPH|nr:protein-L-isoaspartate O-methyltransferase [Neorhizobium alkalisoli]TWF56437.1 protein-L-isoaspartate(D-aspartate) O-methyltransferase [Neorhizobium alkalisoli]
MIDFDVARNKMVENQIRTTDVTAHSVLEAFYAVPREEFVPVKAKALAYVDTDIEICPGRYLMEASPLAKLLQLAAITKDDAVLEIGGGTGYVAALLSLLAGSVVSVEADQGLATAAGEKLKALGYDNATVVAGDMEAGSKKGAPYDIIFVSGSVEEIPQALFDQLRDGGRLVGVIGYGNAAQAVAIVKEQGVLSQNSHFNASIRPLPGFRKAREFVF